MKTTQSTVYFDFPDVDLACTLAGEGPLVLLAHGFPDDASTFAGQVPALVSAGYRVACPTLRGYAPSGVPRSKRYDAESLGQDLVAIADRLSPGAPVRLAGHDWGAIAAFAAAALAPDRFSHLCTMAVPHLAAFVRSFGPAQARRSWYMGLFQLPRVAEARLEADDFALVDRLWRDWSPGYTAPPEEMRAVKAGLVGRSTEALSFYRALRAPHALFGESRRLVFAKVRVPSMHLHGADDGCIGASTVFGAHRFYEAPFAMRIVPGAGHFLQREQPEVVSAALVAFFARRVAGGASD